ncbi:hypothetical protein [Streptomyces sp. NBC_00989]|uniref:hypothetical protein n=1 Tax=Streptomyces sp. NBC_00989 TaxID=2903705 RepID=UPI0038699579|nr:hypothetical protein OG714_24595 [Streptomyces sp. NBC_00989]
MTNPYTTPIPPTPRPPDTRPLYRRVLVWVGGSALFVTGALIGSAGDDGQQPVETKVKPATTITATVTAAPEPGPTVTKTVKAKASPGPTVTVTVTKTATAKAANTGSGSGSGSGSQDSAGTCTIVSNAGNCYSAGQFCRNSDHGAITTTASGTKIKCAYSSNAWRWTYI